MHQRTTENNLKYTTQNIERPKTKRFDRRIDTSHYLRKVKTYQSMVRRNDKESEMNKRVAVSCIGLRLVGPIIA